MTILGITGGIGHGKTSLAEAFVKNNPDKTVHLESFQLVAEVADALHSKLKAAPPAGDFDDLNNWLKELPAILKRVTHTSVNFEKLKVLREHLGQDPRGYQKLFQHLDALHTNPALAKSKITSDNKSQYRPILQWLGGYMVAKLGSAVWWDEMVRRAQKAGHGGADLVVMGGVRYPGDSETIRKAGGIIIQVNRPDMEEADLQDPTERERNLIKADITVINNGTLGDLQKCAKKMLNDVQSSKYKERYVCQNPARSN